MGAAVLRRAARRDTGRRVELVGWVRRRRDLGGIIFVDLRDREGWVQVLFPEEPLKGAGRGAVRRGRDPRRRHRAPAPGRHGQPRHADRRDRGGRRAARAAQPAPRRRRSSSRTRSTPREELRLRHRFLDLRRPEMMANLVLRDRITFAVRQLLPRDGVRRRRDPDPDPLDARRARATSWSPRACRRGTFYALPQSPQLFKQLLQVAGLGRYVQIARCFRDEDLRADRQPEFTQVDVEASFVEEEDIYALDRGACSHASSRSSASTPPRPFPRLIVRRGDGAVRRRPSRHALRASSSSSSARSPRPAPSRCSRRPPRRAGSRGSWSPAAPPSRASSSTSSPSSSSRTARPACCGSAGPPRGSARRRRRRSATTGVAAFLARRRGRPTTTSWSSSAAPAKVVFAALGALRVELARRLGLIRPGEARVPLGDRLPAPRVGRGDEALLRLPPPVHLAQARGRRAPRVATPAGCGPAPTTW